jgi:hypothetical protein
MFPANGLPLFFRQDFFHNPPLIIVLRAGRLQGQCTTGKSKKCAVAVDWLEALLKKRPLP